MGGQVKLGDFGLAKLASEPAAGAAGGPGARLAIEDGRASSSSSEAAAARRPGPPVDHTAGVGTRSYASPEQIESGDYAQGPASDIYSLGLIFLEVLLVFRSGMERALAFEGACGPAAGGGRGATRRVRSRA